LDSNGSLYGQKKKGLRQSTQKQPSQAQRSPFESELLKAIKKWVGHIAMKYIIFNYIAMKLPIYVTLDHNTSHKLHGYICSNSQQYIVWVKILPKIIRILSKDHVP